MRLLIVSVLGVAPLLAAGTDYALDPEKTFRSGVDPAAPMAAQLPANFHGLWNDSNNPAWHSDYHTHINLQMNSWLAEPANRFNPVNSPRRSPSPTCGLPRRTGAPTLPKRTINAP